MAGQKKLVNQSKSSLQVTLHVRAGGDPASRAGLQSVYLAPGASTVVTYGNPENVYLNGFTLIRQAAGRLTIQNDLVSVRGNDLDNRLNTKNCIIFSDLNGALAISSTNL